jgi:hypothetical protein
MGVYLMTILFILFRVGSQIVLSLEAQNYTKSIFVNN